MLHSSAVVSSKRHMISDLPYLPYLPRKNLAGRLRQVSGFPASMMGGSPMCDVVQLTFGRYCRYCRYSRNSHAARGSTNRPTSTNGSQTAWLSPPLPTSLSLSISTTSPTAEAAALHGVARQSGRGRRNFVPSTRERDSARTYGPEPTFRFRTQVLNRLTEACVFVTDSSVER